MPESEDANRFALRVRSVDDEICADRKEPRAGTFRHQHSDKRGVSQQFSLADQGEPKAFRYCGIVARDEFDDFLQIRRAAGGKNYLPTHERSFCRSSSAERPPPASISRSASSNETKNCRRSSGFNVSNPKRRASRRDSKNSRSATGRCSMASSISVMVLISL